MVDVNSDPYGILGFLRAVAEVMGPSLAAIVAVISVSWRLSQRLTDAENHARENAKEIVRIEQDVQEIKRDLKTVPTKEDIFRIEHGIAELRQLFHAWLLGGRQGPTPEA